MSPKTTSSSSSSTRRRSATLSSSATARNSLFAMNSMEKSPLVNIRELRQTYEQLFRREKTLLQRERALYGKRMEGIRTLTDDDDDDEEEEDVDDEGEEGAAARTDRKGKGRPHDAEEVEEEKKKRASDSGTIIISAIDASDLVIETPYQIIEKEISRQMELTKDVDADYKEDPSQLAEQAGLDLQRIPTYESITQEQRTSLLSLTEQGLQDNTYVLPRKEQNYVTQYMQQASLMRHGNRFKKIAPNEVLLRVAFHHPERNIKTQEFEILASQKLTDLKDALYCLNDHIISGSATKSGYFFIENTLYNDMRDPNNIDYSQNVISWVNSKKRYEEPNLARYTAQLMEETSFYDLSIRIGERYLYCIAEGTSVTLPTGVSVPIESIISGTAVLAWDEHASATCVQGQEKCQYGGAVPSVAYRVWSSGEKPCVELTLEDGRTLVATPDHKVRTTIGWSKAGDLHIGDSRVLVAPDAPLDHPSEAERALENEFKFEIGSTNFTMRSPLERTATLSFMRLLGFVTSQRVSRENFSQEQSILCTVSRFDAERIADDIENLTKVRPEIERRSRQYRIPLPPSLVDSITEQNVPRPSLIPSFLHKTACPLSVVREFLGAFFGGIGEAPRLQEDAQVTALTSIYLLMAAELDHHQQQILSDDISALLDLFDITCQCSMESSNGRAISLDCSALAFSQRIGFRYSGIKSVRLCAAAAWYRRKERILSEGSPAEDESTQPAEERPSEFFKHIDAANWFENDCKYDDASLPLLALTVVDRREYRTASGGNPVVYDLSVEDTTSFVANGVVVHNCHQGNCNHYIVFTEIRLINSDTDSDNYYIYPKRIFQSKIRRRRCTMCDIFPAKFVTYNDKLSADDPTFYCDNCYRQFHYDEKGQLLFSDFEVFRYYHDG